MAVKSLKTSWDKTLFSSVTKNPLYGRKDIDFKTVSYNNSSLNEKFIKLVQETLQNSQCSVPTPANCNVALLRYISGYIKQNPPEQVDKKYCLNLRKAMYVDGICAKLITERVVLVAVTLNRFIQENGNTFWLNEVCTSLSKITDWQPLKETRFSRGGVAELNLLSSMTWSSSDVDKSIKDLIVKVVYGSEENHIEFTKWIDNLGKKPKLLIPAINYLRGLSDKEPERCSGSTCTIPSEKLTQCGRDSIIRSYNPNGQQIYDMISIDGKPFSFKSDSETVEESKRNFFTELFMEFDEEGDKNLQEEVEKLFSDKDCSFTPILAAGTIECWSIAHRMLRFLFPGLFSAPFLMKIMQGTVLDINIESMDCFSVTQHKKYQISLRREPNNPDSLTPQAKPIGEFSLNWMVSYKNGYVTGRLDTGSIEFSDGISPYEKGEIYKTLSKPAPLLDGWREGPFPETTRTINFIE
jgi:hypothetical protein